MATEDAEFQERSGLKRKLTGPPRLLLGKSRSLVQKDKLSDTRKSGLDKTNDGPMDTAQEDQGNNEADAELQEMTHDSDMAFTAAEDNVQTDVHEVGLVATSRKDDKKRKEGRSKVRVRIQRIFSPAFMCIKRNKEEKNRTESSLQNVQANNNKLNFQGCECGTRMFCMRLWPIMKKRSSGEKEQGQCSENFNETAPATSYQFVRTVDGPESSVNYAHEQLNESSMTQKNMVGIHGLHIKDEGTKIIMLTADVTVDLHANQDAGKSNLSCAIDEEEPSDRDPSNSQLSCPEQSNSNTGTSPSTQVTKYTITEVLDLDKTLPSAHQCKPVITIEDTSDEENYELFKNPRCETLAALLSLNGPTYDYKTKETLNTSGQNDFSELVLMQTALSLVQDAIRGAVEQLSAEGHRIDQEHS